MPTYGASRGIANRRARGVSATAGTGRNVALGIHFYIGLNIIERVGITRLLFIFQGPGLSAAIDLAQGVNAGILL